MGPLLLSSSSSFYILSPLLYFGSVFQPTFFSSLSKYSTSAVLYIMFLRLSYVLARSLSPSLSLSPLHSHFDKHCALAHRRSESDTLPVTETYQESQVVLSEAP